MEKKVNGDEDGGLKVDGVKEVGLMVNSDGKNGANDDQGNEVLNGDGLKVMNEVAGENEVGDVPPPISSNVVLHTVDPMDVSAVDSSDESSVDSVIEKTDNIDNSGMEVDSAGLKRAHRNSDSESEGDGKRPKDKNYLDDWWNGLSDAELSRQSIKVVNVEEMPYQDGLPPG